MRALAIAAALAAPACYGPQLAPCSVHCANHSQCPADMQCGSDLFCHGAGDTTNCANAMFSVTIRKSGTGTGVVNGGPSLVCGGTCAAQFAQGSQVTLTAMRDNDSRFVQWGDACFGFGTDPTCTLTIDGDKNVSANFGLAEQLTLVMQLNNGATGRVFSPTTPGAVDCTSSCSVFLDKFVPITLTAQTPNTFVGFSSPDCFGTADCTEPMSTAVTVTATFNLP
jgi:hypothetical protein